MPLKVVIFDVYNTLFRNDTSFWIDVFADICRIQELPVSPEEFWNCWKPFEMRFRQTRTNMEHPEESAPFKTYQVAWGEAFVKAFDSLGIKGDAGHAAQLSVDSMASREPYDDTFTFLEYVGSRWKRALLTNADNDFIQPLIRKHAMSFDAVITSEMVGAYKPDPRVFQRVLQETGVLPEEALYVGDTLLDDVHGAKLAGMTAAWLNRSKTDRDPTLLPPDYEATELSGLTSVLELLGERG
jgi:2-haloacid dehalogenase